MSVQPDSEDNDEILFCDGCNVAVHQSCYGVPEIPQGTWYCRACASGARKPTPPELSTGTHLPYALRRAPEQPLEAHLAPACALCPGLGGALKTVSDDKFAGCWAHVSCALWIPECGFGNNVTFDPIRYLSWIPVRTMYLYYLHSCTHTFYSFTQSTGTAYSYV